MKIRAGGHRVCGGIRRGRLAGFRRADVPMKIKLDENLPARLADWLKSLGYDADTVAEEGLQGRPDTGVWAAAKLKPRIFTGYQSGVGWAVMEPQPNLRRWELV